ncbi:MAG: YqaJ viral recombinase family protein [Pseudomonas sp.]|nr:YqaJ viral recombinase family protein [Pseudomonas sp.]
MKVVDIAQRSPEWHQWRREGVSATSCAIIMGENPDKTPLELWRELVGIDTPPDLGCIPQVRRGVKFEPLALQAFEDKYGQVGLPFCAESTEHPFIRASFDGVIADGSPVEIKNLSDDNHLDVLTNRDKSKAYLLYRWQLTHQLIVSGAQRGYLWCWSPKHEPICLVVERDDLLVKRIIKAEAAFWNLVTTATPPEADPERDFIPHSMLDLDRWRIIAAARRDTEQKIAEAKKLLVKIQADAKEMDDRLLELMGDFKRADAFGIRISRYDVEGRVNWKGVAESLDPQIPADVIEQHRADSHTATRVSVNTEFDFSNYQPEVMPTPRQADGQVDSHTLLVAGVFTF